MPRANSRAAKGQVTQIKLRPEVMAQVDDLVKNHGMNRAEVMRSLMRQELQRRSDEETKVSDAR